MWCLSVFSRSHSSVFLGSVALFALALQAVSFPATALAESAFRPFGPSNSNQGVSQPVYNVPNTGFGAFQQNNAYYNNYNPYNPSYNPYTQQTIIINRSCGQRANAFSAQGLSVPQRVGPAPALPTWGVGSPATGSAMPNRTVGGPAQLR
jgi:hypothetical protein